MSAAARERFMRKVEAEDLRRAFDRLDVKGDVKIDAEELNQVRAPGGACHAPGCSGALSGRSWARVPGRVAPCGQGRAAGGAVSRHARRGRQMGESKPGATPRWHLRAVLRDATSLATHAPPFEAVCKAVLRGSPLSARSHPRRALSVVRGRRVLWRIQRGASNAFLRSRMPQERPVCTRCHSIPSVALESALRGAAAPRREECRFQCGRAARRPAAAARPLIARHAAGGPSLSQSSDGGGARRVAVGWRALLRFSLTARAQRTRAAALPLSAGAARSARCKSHG